MKMRAKNSRRMSQKRLFREQLFNQYAIFAWPSNDDKQNERRQRKKHNSRQQIAKFDRHRHPAKNEARMNVNIINNNVRVVCILSSSLGVRDTDRLSAHLLLLVNNSHES